MPNAALLQVETVAEDAHAWNLRAIILESGNVEYEQCALPKWYNKVPRLLILIVIHKTPWNNPTVELLFAKIRLGWPKPQKPDWNANKNNFEDH